MTETNPNYVPVDWADEASDRNRQAVLAEAAEHDRRLVLGDTTVAACGSAVPHGYHNWLTALGARECSGLLDPDENAERSSDADVGNHELLCPMLETATLNSAGDPIKVGDRVHHLADVNQPERDTGVVTYVGLVEIHGVTVENGCRCRWDGSDDETPHHVDLLTVLL